MGHHVGDRALVLGGSIAGLLAARVLSESYAEVTVVDRDVLTGVTTPRRGAPHAAHAHGLLARGHQIIDELFPGITPHMTARGVPLADLNKDMRWYIDGHRLAAEPSDLRCLSATRPDLEAYVRERVQALPNVTFREEHDILGITTTADRGRVTGARIQSRAAGSEPEAIEADLVVDATGRGSRTPAWLEALGYRRPEEEKVKIGLAYTTRHFRLKSDPFGGDLGIMPIATPDHPRGGFFSRLTNDGTYAELSLTGVLGDHPPTDPDGFMEFAKSLPVPDIYESIKDATPLTDLVTFRFPASVRRHYNKLTRFPERLIVTGDAVASFNPVYGQGMTIAALDAMALAEELDRGVPQPLRYFRKVAKLIDGPWATAVGGDLGFPGVEGRRPLRTRVENAYTGRFLAAAMEDPSLTTSFMRVTGLIDPPTALMRPRTLIKVFRPKRKAATPAAPRIGDRYTSGPTDDFSQAA
jgi:2-polyprenyl-6-methoxyphenol hydroxylase-like FAD-dependent oxidoreductase